MRVIFAWDDWNSEHVQKHGSNRSDAQYVIEHASDPFPREVGGGKYLVWGQTSTGAYLEVIFTFRSPDEIPFESLSLLEWSAFIDYAARVAVYVLHSMPMKKKQLRQYRRIRSKP